MDETDEVSLPLYFNSLVAIFSLVPSLPSSPTEPSCFFQRKIRYIPSPCPSLLFLHLCVSSVDPSSSPPPLIVDSSASYLVLFSHSSIPRLYFFLFFSRFSESLFSTFLGNPTVFASLVLPFLLHILLVWRNIFLPLGSSVFVVQSFVAHCYQLTPTLGSPFNVPTLFQKAAPVSAFCSRVSRTRKEERRRAKITRRRARARARHRTKISGGSSTFATHTLLSSPLN